MTVSILTGDTREMLRTLPERSVQTVVTSPPYFGLRSYLPEGHPDKALEIGLESTPEAYIANLVDVFREVRRVMRDDGTLWLNIGDSYCGAGYSNHTNTNGVRRSDGGKQKHLYVAGLKPKDRMMIPAQVALALRADGWWLRDEIIWHKKAPMPSSVTDRTTPAHEMVYLLSKRARYFYDAEAIAEPAVSDHPSGNGYKRDARESFKNADGTARGNDEQWDGVGGTRNRRSVWTLGPEPSSLGHYAMMPTALADICIRAGSSERGQCPHCGAPWVRQVETERLIPAAPSGSREVGRWTGGESNLGGRTLTKFTGWSPSCACPEHQPVPQMILDPFAGAGTTGLVADRLQRNATLIELDEANAQIARERINGEAGIFAPVAAE